MKLGALLCVMAIAACSNGRGSVEETGEQTDPEGFTVGGAVSGLSGTGLTLQLNGGAEMPVAANGAFTFPDSLTDGAAYDVTIRAQPGDPEQTCEVSSGAGRISGANVTNVAVVCTTGGAAFTVGGTVTGLTGSGLILRNNGVEDLPITADGEFIFPTVVATGAAYSVTVAEQPANPAQTCSVEDGDGVMGATDITSVRVICSTSAFTVGGAVTGLAGLGLRLINNGEALAIGADGPFTFRNPVASGAAYAVTVDTQPAGQTCIIENGSGTVESADIADVTVTCASDVFTIGGSISGLAPGARVVLRLNAAGEAVEHEARRNGGFTFDRHLTTGTGYVVAVSSNPTNPAQECVVANAAGIVSGANISNVTVTCTTQSFTVGGTVEGLQGSGLVLRLNGANDLPVAGNGNFTFETQLASGAAYEVSVAANPETPPQTCTVQRGTGTVGNANVRNVNVRCALNTYPVGGTVSGLAGGSVVLENNGGNAVEVAADGAFTFSTPIATGAPYDVTVQTQPANPRQSCTVANGTGTVGSAPVTNVAVTCVSIFTVGGTVSGLAARGLVLRNNGRDDVTMNADGSFTFATPLTSGDAYDVTIAAQGALPSQTCVVANGSGTIGAADVTNVAITCTTNSFTIGGNVSGLLGIGLVLQNNAGNDLAILGNGGFEFSASVPSGGAYNVTVARQPDPLPFLPRQTCTVASGSGSGTVAAADIVDVVVSCQ